MTIPQSQDFHPRSDSDESLACLLFSNQSLYPGANCEVTMLQEALATTTEAFPETKPSSRRMIGLQIVASLLASLLLIGMGLLGQLSYKTDLVSPPLALDNEENMRLEE